jgi:hypothetical protein
MANKKFVDLPELTTMSDATIIPTSDGTTTKKITGANLKTYFQSGTSDRLVNGSHSAILGSTGVLSVPGNIIPPGSGAYTLGDSTHKWADIWIGPNTLNIQDQNTGNNAELTIYNGALRINGATVIELGNTKLTTSGITFPDATTQTTAFTGLQTSVSGNAGTATKLATARAINGVDFDGSAAITVTAAAGTLTGTELKSTVVTSSLTSVGTLNGVTSNALTAFIAGDAAISGVALQLPREGALRNLYNGADNNIYFDVSIGGASHGQFQFRSSSAFTNVLTMSPTAFNVNTNAVVTARTPSFGRTAWNSAIDTELTIDDFRFRVASTGGIHPQVISNTAGTKNVAWQAIAAITGHNSYREGNTGVFVANNAWTSFFTGHGMDAAGDTVTVTLQDKAASRIYRVTFMRSDNGSTTGYNIIAERLL